MNRKPVKSIVFYRPAWMIRCTPDDTPLRLAGGVLIGDNECG